MDVFTLLLLVSLTVLTPDSQTAAVDENQPSETRSERLREVSVSMEEEEEEEETTAEASKKQKAEEERDDEELIPGKERKEETMEELTPDLKDVTETHGESDSRLKKEEEEETLRRSGEMMPEEEEKMGRLVAGINLQEKEGGHEERKEGEAERKDVKNANHNDTEARNLTPPLNTSSTQQGREVQIPTTPKPDTPLHHQLVLVPPVSPNPTGRTALFEDLLSEVLQSPGHHLRLNELEENSEDEVVRGALFKPAWTKETTSQVNKKEEEVVTKASKPKTEAKDLKDPSPVLKITEKTNLRVRPAQVKPTGETKVSEKRNATTKTRKTSNRPTKTPRDKIKKDNKTQKPPQKKKKKTEENFPYFKDEYCPPECACYGRVVQCSDKGLDKVPYGIPYNARYILLMNNLIHSIQLDLLDEYVSMEFLVLSNNRLTDGAIEGAFEGIPALKRLYLDRNLLGSVPNDLPVSLEELRLDNNHLSVMSEAVWARCPGLLVLSLSNNSLGNGSESLPDRIFSPLSNLRTLNLDQNQLKAVPLGLPRSIRELYFKGNLIERFRGGALDGRSELLLLDLSANRLTNRGLSKDSLLNASQLESLNLEGNRLKQVPKHLPCSLKTLNLEGNLISSVKKAVFSTLKNLEHLGLARNKIFKVAPGAFKALLVLHQLDLSHNTLRQVPRQLPAALHSVALTHNRIQAVPRDAFCWGGESLSALVRVQLEHNLIDMGRLDAQAFRCLRGFQVVHFY